MEEAERVALRCGWSAGTDPGLSRRHFREPSPHDPIHTVDGFQRILYLHENGCPLSIYPSLATHSVPLSFFDPLMVQTDAQESYAFSADINQLLSLSKFARHPRSANPYPRLRQQHGHVSPTELRSNPSFSLLLSLYT